MNPNCASEEPFDNGLMELTRVIDLAEDKRLLLDAFGGMSSFKDTSEREHFIDTTFRGGALAAGPKAPSAAVAAWKDEIDRLASVAKALSPDVIWKITVTLRAKDPASVKIMERIGIIYEGPDIGKVGKMRFSSGYVAKKSLKKK